VYLATSDGNPRQSAFVTDEIPHSRRSVDREFLRHRPASPPPAMTVRFRSLYRVSLPVCLAPAVAGNDA